MEEKDLQDIKSRGEAIIIECQTKIDLLDTQIKAINPQVNNISTYHSQLTEIKKGIETVQTNINEILGGCNQTKGQIDSTFSSANEILQKIDAAEKDGKLKVDTIAAYFPTFEELRNKITNTETGIEATLGKASSVLKEIEKTKEDSIGEKIKSEKLVEEIKKLKDEVEKLKTDSESYKNDISAYLQLVSDAGNSNSFDKRRRSQWSLVIWGSAMLLGVGLGVYLFDTAFLNKDHQEIFNSIGNEFVKFLFRITVTSPAVFLIWFSAAQFSKERYVLEQYEYKTSTAIAINSYAKLLKDRFPDTKYDDQRYAQITELIGKIFKETEYFKQNTKISNQPV